MLKDIGDVLLVGSVPLETVEDVFRTCAKSLGRHAYALPDGEVGERSTWIMALPYLTYVHNQDIEPIVMARREDVKSPEDHSAEKMAKTFSLFRFKPGVTETVFDLHFRAEALKSYEVFRRLRDDGAIPSGMRFQVSLPCAHDGTLFFPQPEDREKAIRSYQRSNRIVVEKILERVPANELVIQWDYCSEVITVIGAEPTGRDLLDSPLLKEPGSTDDLIGKYTSSEYLAPMVEMIPDEVLVGFHLCYGTWGGWPDAEVEDIGLCVRLANAMIANSPRRVDFVHLPVLRTAGDKFFKPLADLRIGKTKVFIGLELSDGLDAMMRRATAARKYLPEFGVSHYCGYGREEPTRVRELLDEIRIGAERL